MSPGGSAQRRPRRLVKLRQTKHEKNQAAVERAIVKVGGLENHKEVQNAWKVLRTGNYGEDQESGIFTLLYLYIVP